MRTRLQTAMMWVMLAATWPSLPVALAPMLLAPTEAAAQARRSSGGYSRPGGSYARTPSFGGGSSRIAPRTPSFGSGGYSRPDSGYDRAPSFSTPSFGDRSYSRSQSGSALNQFRAQQDAAQRQQQAQRAQQQAQQNRTPDGRFAPGFGGSFGGGVAGGALGGLFGGGQRNVRPNWYSNQGWAAPSYALQGRRSFGVVDGLFLYFLLDNLTRAGSASWFHNNADTPEYRQWRAQAEQQAQDNADLRQKLAALDARLAEQEGAPKDPNYVPPDTPPAVIDAPQPDRRTPSVAAANDNEAAAADGGAGGNTGGGGSGLVWVVLLAGGAGLAFLALRRRRAASGGAPVSNLGSAARMVANKVSGTAYTPDLFRVGMTLTVDPTPFILAEGAIKATAPEGVGGLVSVEGVGAFAEDPKLVRLYLPGTRSFLQLHLDGAGKPDESRQFTQIDEVNPADPGEWTAWLDPREGMIGWPEFQTKDGKVYARAWAPGSARIQPRRLSETIEEAGGARKRVSVAMLYAAPTGRPAPAPETEYILVAAVDAGGQAWVEVHAGIDINPATLQLA